MNERLQSGLKALERRVIGVGFIAGAGRALIYAIVVTLAFMWIDLMIDLPDRLRLLADVAALIVLGAVWSAAALAAMRASSSASLARRVDDVSGADGQVLSGVDLATVQSTSMAAQPITASLAQIAVERAAELVGRISPNLAVPAASARKPFVAVGCILLALLIAAGLFPRLIATQWMRFADPFGDHPPYSRLAFEVSPGAMKVIYGKSFEVQAKTAGPAPERVELIYRPAGGADETLPMFPQSEGNWQATLASVVNGGEYFVRAGRARSYRYPVDVITVPKIESVRFRILPPTYTNSGAYEGPLPQSGIAGLPGTKVQVWVKSNRPLAGGDVQLSLADQAAATQPSNNGIVLSKQGADATEVSGSFTITSSGKMTLDIKDIAGQASTDPFSAPITLLADARPFVRVTEPRAESLATPDVTLNVGVTAEDDYGLSRVQLYRALNDSAGNATDLPIPKPPPTVLPAESQLKLSQYGLKPGDIVKLYARAEDTDPAGPKGSESSVVTVRIISQEEMKKLMLAREGMEVLESKYASAARRLEQLDEKMKQLQDEIAKQEPGKLIDEKLRKELEKLAEAAAKASEDIRESAKIDLPLDLDQALNKNLEELAKKTDELAKDSKRASTQPSLSFAGANDKVAEMRKKLGAAKEQYKEEVTFPIEHLAKIFPVIQDEAMFLELYQVQRDLEQRMESLKGTEGKDDPKLKARMRDLGEEQRQVREALKQLVENIEDHAAELPDDKRLDDLRNTAKKFAAAVKASDVSAQMSNSEAALGEFAGTKAQQDSKNAADTLEKFIGKCNAMGDQASACLKFQPKLSSGMGNSVQQLLDSMGLGKGMGGGSGGYSARRSTMANVGLYGTIPLRSQESAKAGGGRADRGTATDGRGGPNDKTDPSAIGTAGKTKAEGESDANVPPQYRRKVGEYFQRVSDELDEK